jgi:hypothetical protein
MAVRNCFVGGFQEKPLPWRGLFLEKKNLSFKRRRKLKTQTQMKYWGEKMGSCLPPHISLSWAPAAEAGGKA